MSARTISSSLNLNHKLVRAKLYRLLFVFIASFFISSNTHAVLVKADVTATTKFSSVTNGSAVFWGQQEEFETINYEVFIDFDPNSLTTQLFDYGSQKIFETSVNSDIGVTPFTTDFKNMLSGLTPGSQSIDAIVRDIDYSTGNDFTQDLINDQESAYAALDVGFTNGSYLLQFIAQEPLETAASFYSFDDYLNFFVGMDRTFNYREQFQIYDNVNRVISSVMGTQITGTATFSLVNVPEPTTLALMFLGLFGLGFNRRKRLH
jgi:PEP-CTERM motif-containing protein